MKKRVAYTVIILLALTAGFSFKKQANTIPPALKITQLTQQFYVFTTWQTYQQIRFPANGLYAVSDSGVVMIDGPWDTSQTKPLLDTIFKRHGKKVVLCVGTHHHDDRTGSFGILKRNGVQTWSSKLTYDWCIKKKEQTAQYQFANDTIFRVGALKIHTYYPGAGHAADNIVVWFEKEKVLYGGCFIKSCDAADLGNLGDADVNTWPESIKKVQQKFLKPAFVIPGHQDWKNKKSLEHTLKLLKKHTKTKN